MLIVFHFGDFWRSPYGHKYRHQKWGADRGGPSKSCYTFSRRNAPRQTDDSWLRHRVWIIL
ncbi:hypothetical protein [Picosynechococcus sp. NKBG042902]|uniref:hypothetical protein n=1 Tax=Picosynechococcus sp. NKBG042902 TaxID=490193 RepID=UPI001268A8A5|nr:hypothetical protein [Picosynechococcus sp. NKBG042902]